MSEAFYGLDVTTMKIKELEGKIKELESIKEGHIKAAKELLSK